MGIIQKRADELKLGDLVKRQGSGSIVVLHAESRPKGFCLRYIHLGNASAPDSVYVPAEDSFYVEVPDLTPAQQHADELVAMLEIAVRGDGGGIPGAEDLLDKIRPPEPPTLAEALEVLAANTFRDETSKSIGGKSPHAAALDLLDRARRAGLLK